MHNENKWNHTSFSLRLLSMEVLKVGRYCYPSMLWTTESENGTLWHGSASYVLNALKEKLPKLEFISDLPKSNWTHPSIQSIADGKTDFDPDLFGYNWERFQFVDYSFPVFNEYIYIISAKQVDVRGKVLDGVFDQVSFALFIIGFCLLTFLSSISIDGNGPSQPLFFITFRFIYKVSSMMGKIFAQESKVEKPCPYYYQGVIAFVVRFYSLCLIVFYSL